MQGSYRRRTVTKPNDDVPHADVDMVVVTTLNPRAHSPNRRRPLQPFLDNNYPDEWKHQDRAIKITPTGKDVTLDLVVTAAPSEIQQEFLDRVGRSPVKATRAGGPAPQPAQTFS